MTNIAQSLAEVSAFYAANDRTVDAQPEECEECEKADRGYDPALHDFFEGCWAGEES